MRGLRILQVFSRYLQPGGEERFAELFTSTLTPSHSVQDYFGSTKELLASGARHPSLLRRAWHNHQVAEDLRRMQTNGKFDLWVIQNSLPGLSPAVYATAFSMGVPVVHFLHNFRLGCTNGFFLNHGKPCERCLDGNFWPAFQTACWRNSRIVSGFMGLILRRARHLGLFQGVRAWVALNQQQKRKHIEMGIPGERIHVVPHFFDPSQTPPPPNPDGDVLFLGRLSPEKGLPHLVEAWARVRPGKRKLLIAGRGPEEDHLKGLAVRLGVKNIEFLGYLPRESHPAVWARTSFAVIPSLWNEPFPLSFLEAWSFQRACLASRLGAMAEHIVSGQDGLLVDPFCSSALAGALQSLLDDPLQAVAMGKAGHHKLVSQFNREIWIQRMEDVFSQALSP